MREPTPTLLPGFRAIGQGWEKQQVERRTLTFELSGEGGITAMAHGAGITAAVATVLLLEGHTALNKPGIILLYTEDVSRPTRIGVDVCGLSMVTRSMKDVAQGNIDRVQGTWCLVL